MFIKMISSRRDFQLLVGGSEDQHAMHIRNAFFGQQPFWANQNWQRRAEISSAPADGIGCGTPEENGFGLFQSVVLVDQADGGRRILVVPDEHVMGRKLCKTDYRVQVIHKPREHVPILLISFVDPDPVEP